MPYTHPSPLRYPGNKRSLIPNIKKLLPTDCHRMVDGFGGSATVVLNMNHPIRLYNEYDKLIFDIIKTLAHGDPKENWRRIRSLVREYGLTQDDKEAFKKFRVFANKQKDPLMSFILGRHSFNSEIRFNSKDEFNSSFGETGISHRMYAIEELIHMFHHRMKNVVMTNLSYADVLIKLKAKDKLKGTFFYFDPPYLASGDTGTYEGWTAAMDLKLMKNLDRLTTIGSKWMMSNVFQHRGFTNEILRAWASNYKVAKQNKTYNMGAWNKAKEREQGQEHNTEEVIITNY